MLLLLATPKQSTHEIGLLCGNVSAIEMASQYEQFFREADKDGSGYLTLDELIKLLRQKGYKETDEKIRVSKSVECTNPKMCIMEQRLNA